MKRKLAILFLIFIACYMGTHYYIKWKNRSFLDSEKTTKLIDCLPNQVREFSLRQMESGKEKELKFIRIDKPEAGLTDSVQLSKAEWQWVSPLVGAEADSGLFNRLASMVCGIYEPIPTKQEEMGDLPATDLVAKEITFLWNKERGSKTATIRFGRMSQNRKNIIELTFDGQKKYFQISPELMQVLSQEQKYFSNMRVMKVALDNIQAAEVERNKKENFHLERDGADWSIVVDGKKTTGAAEAARFINRISTLRALEIINNNYPAEECEKNGGQVVVKIQALAGQQEKIYFNTKGGEYLEACNSARKSKFKIHKEMWKYLVTPLKELTKK